MSLPTGEIMPMPVTTTRRLLMLCSFVIPSTAAVYGSACTVDTSSASRDAGAPYGIGRYKLQKRKLRLEAQCSVSLVVHGNQCWSAIRHNDVIDQSLEWALM
jgi:hypothetical protein